MQRPNWIPRALWKSLKENYPRIESAGDHGGESVALAPRIFRWGFRREENNESFQSKAKFNGDALEISWRTGTDERGNYWRFHVDEATLLSWLDRLRLERTQRYARRHWRDTSYQDVLIAWLQRNKPENAWELEEVEEVLDQIDEELRSKIKAQEAPRRFKRKPAGKKKVLTRKKPTAKMPPSRL